MSITFGKHGARVMGEDKEVQHYAMHVDPKFVNYSGLGPLFSEIYGPHADFPTAGHLYLDRCPVGEIPHLKHFCFAAQEYPET